MRSKVKNSGRFGVAASLALVLSLLATAVVAAGRHQVTTAKPMSPIAIDYQFDGEPAVGQPLRLSLSISAASEMTGLSLMLAAGDPLAMIDPLGPMGLALLAAYEPAEFEITVLPLTEQTHYLNVTVTASLEGVQQTQSIAVPIRLGDARLEKSAGDTADASAEGVRSFRAVETIH